MKIGILGDIHPSRSLDLSLLDCLKKEKPDLIICTGDIEDLEILEELEKISRVICVKGNVDKIKLPEREILEIEGKKILVFHSKEIYPRGDINQILYLMEKEGVDIAIFGHTHLPLFIVKGKKILINPGSLTGAWSGEGIVPPKSFSILEIKEKEMEIKFHLKDFD